MAAHQGPGTYADVGDTALAKSGVNAAVNEGDSALGLGRRMLLTGYGCSAVSLPAQWARVSTSRAPNVAGV